MTMVRAEKPFEVVDLSAEVWREKTERGIDDKSAILQSLFGLRNYSTAENLAVIVVVDVYVVLSEDRGRRARI